MLTGFLGAGKTTALNRVLGAEHHRRLAVIVNELGRIDVDGKILRGRAGAVMELAGGCVCHEVRTQEELWAALRDVATRWRPELVVLETTGIAEPAPLAQGLAELPADQRPAEIVGVVTVVEAEAGLTTLDRFAEARAQVAQADRLLLSKLDLVPPDALVALHARLARDNPGAERASFPATAEGDAALTSWLLAPRAAGPLAVAHAHHHGHQLVAASYVDDVPLLAEPLLAALESFGPALVRAKGWVSLHGENRRAFLERAGARTGVRLQEPWPAGARRTELVLIGEDLDPAAVRRRLWACRALAA